MVDKVHVGDFVTHKHFGGIGTVLHVSGDVVYMPCLDSTCRRLVSVHVSELMLVDASKPFDYYRGEK